jgi:hypothetical protein
MQACVILVTVESALAVYPSKTGLVLRRGIRPNGSAKTAIIVG